MSEAPPLLRMEGIGKSFGGRPVLQDVSFTLARGEIHALLGENGAGKSTLMNVLAGIYAPDAGRIRIDGEDARIRRPRDAAQLGIGMVHQHFRLVPDFTAAENLCLAGNGRPGLATIGEAANRLQQLGASTGLAVRPEIAVRDLSVAERQRVEILRVLAVGARILVLDEPTAVLTDQEAERLLAVVRGLAADGLAIVLITHRLREVAAAADRVSVMRAGRMVTPGLSTAGLDAARLAREMTGEAPPPPTRRRREPGPVRLEAKELAVARSDGTKAVDGISLEVRGGEILGVAGVGGNGQQELADALIGLAPLARGRVLLDGVDVTSWAVWPRRERGLHYVPSDRSRLALVGELPVADNLAMAEVRAGRFGRFLLAARAIREAASDAIASFGIAGATPEREARLLSGGNAQKLVLARELHDRVRVLVAHSPTRGLDVAAYAFVHGILAKAATAGAGIVLISEDLDEILGLSDRIVVMSRGRIAGERSANPSRAELGALMLGHA